MCAAFSYQYMAAQSYLQELNVTAVSNQVADGESRSLSSSTSKAGATVPAANKDSSNIKEEVKPEVPPPKAVEKSPAKQAKPQSESLPKGQSSSFSSVDGHDTSIIITSDLVPSCPSTNLVESTIKSFHKYFVGLPLDIPIFVSVDKPPDRLYHQGENIQRLEEYIQNLKKADYSPFTNVKIVPMEEHKHLAGSINHVLENYAKTPLLYVIKHNEPFIRAVNHDGLVKAMKQNPDVLRVVRFLLQDEPHGWTIRKSECHVQKSARQFKDNGKDYETIQVNAPDGNIKYNGMDFYATATWATHNHIATREFYQEILKGINFLGRSTRYPMQSSAAKNCNKNGQLVYGPRLDPEPYIKELDVAMR